MKTSRNPSHNSHPSRRNALLSLVGNTRMVALHFAEEGITLHAKCEFLNPSGSIKDRLAQAIILDAERRSLLKPDSVILECSSGNTGIALATLGAACGYGVTILMSRSASQERRTLIEHLGAQLILFDGGSYQSGIDLSREMAAADPRYFLPRQFENPLNALDHEEATGPEIIQQAPGPIDVFVTGFGTGGTLAGCGRAIKARYPHACILAMTPDKNSLLPAECPCCHCIEGVAEGFRPPLLETATLDGEIQVGGDEALAMTRRLHREFGLLVGTSSGANVVAALRAARQTWPGAVVVTLLCDAADRYFSAALFRPAG